MLNQDFIKYSFRSYNIGNMHRVIHLQIPCN